MAAGRRGRGRRPAARRRRGDARQEHDGRAGSSTCSRPAAATRARSSGALLPAALTGIGRRRRRRAGAPATPFVVEADEYAGNFDAYRPDVIVLTSAEWDHPDVFADRAAVLAAFEAWIRGAAVPAASDARPVLVANVGRRGVAELVARLADWPGRIVATALVDAAPQRLGSFARGIAERFRTAPAPRTTLLGRITAAEPDATTLEIAGLDPLAGPRPVRLPTAGRHNAANALGVAGAAAALGVDAAARSPPGWPRSAGVGRRLERKGEARGVVVYDDYGHHPTAIRETLAAVRQREPGRRVWAVYEPLTYHRTAALLDALRRRARAAPTRSPSPTSGPAATRTPPSPRRPAWPRPSRGATRASPSPRRAASRRPPPGSPARSARGRRPGHGRRPLVPDRRAAARAPGGRDDHHLRRGATTCSRRSCKARRRYDGDALRRRCSPRTPSSSLDPFAPPLAGHNDLRAYLLEAAEAERQLRPGDRASLGRRATPSLAAWHASWNRRTDEAKVRQAGFLAAEVGGDGRIVRLRLWTVTREHLAG